MEICFHGIEHLWRYISCHWKLDTYNPYEMESTLRKYILENGSQTCVCYMAGEKENRHTQKPSRICNQVADCRELEKETYCEEQRWAFCLLSRLQLRRHDPSIAWEVVLG